MLAIVLAIVLASERQRGRQDDVLLSDASIVAGLCDLFGLAQLHRGGIAVESRWLVVLRKPKAERR
jgi:hypothetical protein